MTAMLRLLLTVSIAAMVTPATAHPVIQGMSGFSGGLLHPLLVPAHLMAVVALGLLIGQEMPRRRRNKWAAYTVTVIAGLAAIAMAFVPTDADMALLVLAALSGLLVALGRRLPAALGWSLAGATGLALGLDSPPGAITLLDANLALLGTALGASIALLIVSEGRSRLSRDWARIGARILGSWIAASAILVLTLRLVR